MHMGKGQTNPFGGGEARIRGTQMVFIYRKFWRRCSEKSSNCNPVDVNEGLGERKSVDVR